MNEQEFDARGILGVLRRQWRLIALSFLLVMTLVVLGLFSLKPAFTSTALILYNPGGTSLLNPTTNVLNSAIESARVDSEVEIVTSESTLFRVIDSLRLLDIPEFQIQPGLREQLMVLFRLAEPTPPTEEQMRFYALERLKDSLRVFRRGLTFLITVSVTSPDPQTAARIANGIADIYIREQIESKIAAMQSSLEITRERANQAADAVANSEMALNSFITSSVDRVVAETGRTDLNQLRAELEALTRQRDTLAATMESVQTSLAAMDWRSVAGALQSDALEALAQRQAELQQQLVTAIDGSQEAVDLREQITAIVADLRTGAERELSSLREAVASTQSEASDLQLQLRSLLLSTDLPPDVVTELYGLQQSAELARSQYQTLLRRVSELDSESYLQTADSRIVSRATPPEEQSFPDVPLMLAAGAVLAVIVGVAAAVLRENFVGGFVSDLQLSSVLRLPVVATIPREKYVKGSRDGVKLSSHADLLTHAPYGPFAEAIRRLQIGVDLALRRSGIDRRSQGGSVILVTSANTNEGKTTTALSLARAYALSGKKALLIDCDLRKPSVNVHLDLPPSPRLHERLADTDTDPRLDELVVRDELTKASVLIGGRPEDATALGVITGEHFARLVEAARRDYEIIVLDAPPVGAVIDAIYLAQIADVIVAMIRYATTSQQDAQKMIAALAEAKRDDVEILGVLGGVEESRAQARRKYGAYYYA
jgi:polysaccharide biosynthesis transport protein